MIPPAFEYAAPDSLAEAIRLLDEGGEDAKPLAGGHSLIPLMKLRLAAPSLLVDLRRIDGLRGIERADGGWRFGSMTRHVDLQVHEELGLISVAARSIADQQVRNRGTIGGSLAHGDPASDLPAVLLALDGEVTAEGPDGSRTIAARDLFVGFLTTSLRPDEILTSVRVPKAPRSAYVKFNRRSQDWALVGVAAVVEGDSARIALAGVGPGPVRAEAAERAFRGGKAAEAAMHAADGLDPPADSAGSADYRRHLARVLTLRALEEASAG
jgi:aerobic carbon-monoxide dehydrogenase medium subunit